MNSLENKIREALPRLKELTKGCLLKKNDCVLEIVNDKKSLIYSVLEYPVFYHEKANKKDFEILGHPIKLNDVLEWCSSKTTDFFIENNKSYFAINYGDKNEKKFYWDLSSVFLADQSDELKEFLNSL